MRRSASVLALLVLTWSNVAAFPCGSPFATAGDAHPEGAHSHTGHGDHRGAPGPDVQDGPSDSDLTPECGVLMACGAPSRSSAAPGAYLILPPRLDDAPLASLHEPSAADLTQDPPPPRRLV